MIDWPEVIKGAIETGLDGVHTSIPAAVTGYLPLLQTCDVEPVIEGMPPLTDVPVLWPRGGGYGLHLPLEAGDSVLLVFCEQDFGPWRLAGIAQAPALLRRHGLYAYAVPGAAPATAPQLGPALYSGAYLGNGAPGGMVVHVGESTIELGAFPFTQQVALASAVEAIFIQFQLWANTHTHTSAAPGSPTTSPIVPASVTGPVGSTVVKCSG